MTEVLEHEDEVNLGEDRVVAEVWQRSPQLNLKLKPHLIKSPKKTTIAEVT